MKRLIAVLVIGLFFSAGVKAENSFDFDLENTKHEDMLEGVLDINIPDFISNIKIPFISPKKELKEWTVMFYSNAKEQLNYSQVWQMLDMKKIGSTDKVNVVVEAGMPIKYDNGSQSMVTFRMAMGEGADHSYIDRRIKDFLKAGTKGPVNYSVLEPFKDDIVKQTKDEDMGDWRNIAKFIKWAKANYPAKRYVFMMYGHGSGFFDPKKPSKGISLDMETGNYVTLPEFSRLMKKTGKVDILVMQACLMQMAEVVYQVKDYVDVAVGSSDLMWAIGYDFKTMLEVLNSKPSASSEILGKLLAHGYIVRAKAFNKGGHASVIGTSKFQGFVDKLNNWVDATIAADNKKSISEGIKNAVRFDIFGITSISPARVGKVSISGDLYDFVDIVTKNLPQNTPEEKIAREKGLELMDYVSSELISTYAYAGLSNTGYDFRRARGLSIHIPPVSMRFGTLEGFENNSETLYWDLPFAKETKWGDFLKWYYGQK